MLVLFSLKKKKIIIINKKLPNGYGMTASELNAQTKKTLFSQASEVGQGQ